MPQPDPPFRSVTTPGLSPSPKTSVKAAPITEWIYHKTIDNLHPDTKEQQMMWLMNRARSNPEQEGIWLVTMADPDVVNAVNYFGVDLDLLMAEFAAIEAKPPAAFDVRLYNAAKVHSDDLILRDAQDHNDQFTQVTDAGFSFVAIRGNVFSYTKSAVHGHAGFNIDWGVDPTGMQPERGHRLAIMSMDGDYSNVGIAMVSETDSTTEVGPLVTTGNYAKANESSPNHYNRFLVGTVWEDLNDNGMYDTGEGMENITIRPDQGSYYAVTANSGGYAIPVSAGDYLITFSGTGLTGDISRMVSVGTTSVLCDLLYAENSSNDEEPSEDTGAADDTVIDEPIIGGGSGGGGCFVNSL
ncbi:MAG: hypothetical protein KKD44_03765 [Proteobacteria bacterium]|nr:hypothetical protein [Pseudomonadota bacterium]